MNSAAPRILILPLLLTAAGLGASAQALADPTHFGSKTPTVDEFVESLKPQERPLRFRGIRPVEATASSQDSSNFNTITRRFDDQSPAAGASPTVTMELKFAFNSYQLTPEAKRVLDNLSAALKEDELAQYTFRVEGHTDAVGSEEYNLSLSQKRALAVQSYLVLEHGIPLERIKVVGKGETELLDPEHPDSGVNRRVAIVNLGGQVQ
ncbi:MAG TPA: OmpA family protein [Gammaproteobacteria bacterium]|nr:OmpA family protein [Gammaproteobacteria bacterium]